MVARARDIYVAAPEKKPDKPRPSAWSQTFEFIGIVVVTVWFGLPLLAITFTWWSQRCGWRCW